MPTYKTSTSKMTSVRAIAAIRAANAVDARDWTAKHAAHQKETAAYVGALSAALKQRGGK